MTQKIKLTDGCPNGCHYCYEPKVPTKYYDMPELKEEYIQILDMNFLSNPSAYYHINALASHMNELVCGVDYRLLDQQIANNLWLCNFIKMRWAWDYGLSQQKVHKKVLQTFLKAGYKSKELSVFMLVNWKIPFVECCKKLDLLKVWNVKVNDCCWDGGYKRAKPVYWTPEQIKKFRRMCREHNQIVNFGIFPELKSKSPQGYENLRIFKSQRKR